MEEALMILKVKVLKTMRSRKGMSAITTKLARSRHVRDVGNVGLCLCILLREQYSEIGPPLLLSQRRKGRKLRNNFTSS